MKKEIKFRLINHLVFLENELKDYNSFKSISWELYSQERSKQRDIERWIENIINSSVDISKIILRAEDISLPDNYKDIVKLISLVKGLDTIDVELLAKWVKFRNIVAHEYLDIRWDSIKKFINETEHLYIDFLNKVKEYVNKQIET